MAHSKRHIRRDSPGEAYEFKPENFEKDFGKKSSKGAEVKALVVYLSRWMRDMKAWGEDVRDDIVRLETAAGVAPGDPGDPPPAPRKEL